MEARIRTVQVRRSIDTLKRDLTESTRNDDETTEAAKGLKETTPTAYTFLMDMGLTEYATQPHALCASHCQTHTDKRMYARAYGGST